jgi:hypothetical protein
VQQLAPARRSGGLPQHGLVSLWDMLEFQASEFVDALRAFSAVEAMVENKVSGSDQIIVGETVANTLYKLNRLEDACTSLGAIITADFVRDAKAAVESGKWKWTDLTAATKQIYAVLLKELARAKLFSLAPHKAEFFDNAIDKFDIETWLSFPSTQDDMDEAGKCFALGRNTACVYHLMRVLERPIMVLAKVLLPNDPSPNWEVVLKKIDAELAKKPSERSFKGDVQFFAEVAAEMRAVKHAWRNRVMHVDTIVTEERAKAIFDATIAFMNVVSKNLSDDGLEDPALDL